MILEGIVTTTNEDGTTNISPMGPRVDERLESFELRPFKTSRTFRNLRRARCGVLHVTDDVLLIAQAVTDQWVRKTQLVATQSIDGQRIADARLGLEFKVAFIDESLDRSSISCRVTKRHEGPELFGLNRAKNAVLEVAILATRLDFLPMAQIQLKLDEYATVVDKTGGPEEIAAFELLLKFIQKHESN